MRSSSIRNLPGFCVIGALTLSLTACGGGTSSGGGTTPPPPPAAEFLFGAGQNSVVAASIDTTTGALTNASYVTGNRGGFGIAATPSATFLYADDVGGGGIDGFSIGASGTLTPLSGSPFPMPGGWSLYLVDRLAIDPSGKFLYVPDVTTNSIVGFTIDSATGALTPIASSPFSAIDPEELLIEASGKFLYASLGGGGIGAFTIDTSTGTLTPILGSPFGGNLPDGLASDPAGKFLFAAIPAYSVIEGFTISQTTGALTPVAGSPYFPGLGQAFPVLYSLTVTPSGDFLYALDSEYGKVYGYSVDGASGGLTPLASSPLTFSYATYMSTIEVEPSGKFLYIGDQTANLTIMSIDQSSGALALLPLTTSPYSPSMTIVRIP